MGASRGREAGPPSTSLCLHLLQVGEDLGAKGLPLCYKNPDGQPFKQWDYYQGQWYERDVECSYYPGPG